MGECQQVLAFIQQLEPAQQPDDVTAALENILRIRQQVHDLGALCEAIETRVASRLMSGDPVIASGHHVEVVIRRVAIKTISNLVTDRHG